MLGDNGGIGVVSTVIDEIFTTLPNLKEKQPNLGNFQRNTVSANLKNKDKSIIDSQPYVTIQAVVLIGIFFYKFIIL